MNTTEDFKMKMILKAFQNRYINKYFKVTGLKSESGAKLNGLIGKIVGFDSEGTTWRFHVEFENDKTIYKIKIENLIDQNVEAGKTIPSKSLQAEKKFNLQRCIQTAKNYMSLAESNFKVGGERPDIEYRVGKLKEHLQQFQNHGFGHVLKCGDFGDRNYQKDSLAFYLMNMKPGCVGNGKFKLDQLYYDTNDKHQAGLRWSEYGVSGFCIPCQIHYIEKADISFKIWHT